MSWQIYGVWAAWVSSLIGLGLIVWKIEPLAATPLVKALFFITLFISFWSTATLAVFSVKNRLVKSRALSKTAYEPIFYDSFLVGLLVSITLMIIVLIKKLFS